MATVVVGYDGSEAAGRALERAALLADHGASVTVVTAVDLPPSGRARAAGTSEEEIAESENVLERGLEWLRERGVAAEGVEVVGPPAAVIVEQARERGADLVVVGTRGMGLAERILLGSVSTHVAHHAPCDVLVVR